MFGTACTSTLQAAISGSGQQHGSVYWASGALNVLQNLSPAGSLCSQMERAFAIKDSPIWRDSSTTVGGGPTSTLAPAATLAPAQTDGQIHRIASIRSVSV
jgi:hypothetical protein